MGFGAFSFHDLCLDGIIQWVEVGRTGRPTWPLSKIRPCWPPGTAASSWTYGMGHHPAGICMGCQSTCYESKVLILSPGAVVDIRIDFFVVFNDD